MIPLIHDLTDKNIVVFGGGKLGTRKAELFQKQSNVYVVGEVLSDRLRQLNVSLLNEKFNSKGKILDVLSGIGEVFLVLAATGDRELDELVTKASHEHGALVNKVDGPIEDVITPAVIDEDPILVAISTRGRSPAMSKFMRKKLEPFLNRAKEMVKLQSELRERLKGEERKNEVLWQVIEEPKIWQALLDDYSKAKSLALEVLEKDE